MAAVEERFAAALAAGSRAQALAARCALIREANEAIADQVRGYHARPWAEGDPDAVVREFLCECGDPACDASLLLPVGALAAGAVLAPNHAPSAGASSIEEGDATVPPSAQRPTK